LVPYYPVLNTCCYSERSVFRDEDTLESLGLNTGAMLYFKDRGLQIGWTTVFLTEYAGPLFVYLWFYRSEGGQVSYIKLPDFLARFMGFPVLLFCFECKLKLFHFNIF
jgi:hypothetical protein